MKPMAPVSVVIPCFRCGKTVARAVASVAAQTVLPAEVILVDDASGDDTPAVLQGLQTQYESGWIKLVSLPHNVGAGSARNAGWAQASQPLIAFLDADDAWHLRKIELQHAYMAANPDVALSGHRHRVVKADALPYWKVSSGHPKSLSKFIMLLSNRLITPSVMLRRDVGVKFTEGKRYVDDHLLWLELICSGSQAVKLPQELVLIYKDLYGVSGLSSHIWLMERSELDNYRRLYHKHHINWLQFGVLAFYSFLKYIRRLMIYSTYLRWKK